MLSFIFHFTSKTVLKMFSKYVIFYVHDFKVMAEEIGLPIRKLSENTSLYLVVGQPKPGNFCLSDWKPNIILLYSNVTSCNSSPERRRGATSFSTLPTKNFFCSFCTCYLLARNVGGSQKKAFYPNLLA